MNILRVKDSQGNWIDIPAIVGPPGRQGDPGAPGAKGDRGDTVIIASRYEDLTFPVTAGTYCLYADKPYVAKTDIQTTESWTAAHWDEVSFEDEIGDLKSAFYKKDGLYIYGGGTGYFLPNKYYLKSTGQVRSDDGWACTDIVDIQEDVTYELINAFSGYSIWNVVCWNESGTFLGEFISRSLTVVSSSIKTAYPTAAKIAFNAYYGSAHPALTHEDVVYWAIATKEKGLLGAENRIGHLETDVAANTAKIKNINSFNMGTVDVSDYVVDHYIIQNSNGSFVSFANGILSGYIPVSALGRTINIKTETLYIGDVALYGASKNPLFAFNINNSSNGYRAYGLTNAIWHGGSTDYVNFSGNDKDLSIEIKDNSGVEYVVFYITNRSVHSSSDEYYGVHDDLSGIPISEILVYGETTLQSKINSNTKKISELEKRIEQITPNGDVILNKIGTDFHVRSRFDSELDIAIKFIINTTDNVFNFDSYYTLPKTSADNVTAGTLFKTATDDMTGVRMNGTIVGGNHGNAYGYKLTFESAHGFTESNIGETWLIDGKEFVIIRIVSDTVIWGGFPVNTHNGLDWLAIEVNSMSRDGVTKTFSSYERGQQITPAINHQTVKVFDDKGNEITENGVYRSSYFDIVNSYDVISSAAMITYLKNHVGNNTNSSYFSEAIADSFFTMNLVLHCSERGSITVYESIGFNRDGDFEFAHGVQSTSGGFNYWSVPGTTFDGVGAIPSARQELTPSTWRDANKPPIRYYQYTNSNTAGNGMVIGYNNKYADGVDDLRKVINSAGFIYETHKMHPFFYSYSSATPKPVTDEDTLSMVGFRCPLITYDNELPSVAWYYVGDDIYLMVDAHSSVNKYIDVPDTFNGRIIEVIEEYGSISIGDIVAGSKIKVIVKNNYGSGYYKLKKG